MPPSKPMTLILLAILYAFFLYHAAIKRCRSILPPSVIRCQQSVSRNVSSTQIGLLRRETCLYHSNLPILISGPQSLRLWYQQDLAGADMCLGCYAICLSQEVHRSIVAMRYHFKGVLWHNWIADVLGRYFFQLSGILF
ncbi:hypothetical protein ES703_115941 [subsurface metagenome]